jgi:hypothetical protein
MTGDQADEDTPALWLAEYSVYLESAWKPNERAGSKLLKTREFPAKK